MTNLTELSKKVYQLQIEKGWCKPDEKRDIEDLKILILSEAFEAFEAYRKGKYAPSNDLVNYGLYLKALSSNPDKEDTSYFNKNIKDTFEDEIADVAIRALDLAGYLGLEVFNWKDGEGYIAKGKDYPKHLFNFTDIINKFKGDPVSHYMVSFIINWCKEMAIIFDFDLMQHIELKLAYNKTRPFRHGGKLV